MDSPSPSGASWPRWRRVRTPPRKRSLPAVGANHGRSSATYGASDALPPWLAPEVHCYGWAMRKLPTSRASSAAPDWASQQPGAASSTARSIMSRSTASTGGSEASASQDTVRRGDGTRAQNVSSSPPGSQLDSTMIGRPPPATARVDYRVMDCRSQGGIDQTCAEVADSNGARDPFEQLMLIGSSLYASG